jgi:hypothetical protein
MAKSSEIGGFSPETKRQLADRAGHHCSLCFALTTCSDEEGKPFRIGDAAHQAAASDSGPRYDPNQSELERSSSDNGLWLCSSCHRKIDGDKFKYPVETLRKLKREAEERARKMVHGEIVFEMKDKEDAAIKEYFERHPMENLLAKSFPRAGDTLLGNGAKLGIQIIPYTAVFEMPRLSHPELLEKGVPRSAFVIQANPTPDNKGVFIVDGREVSRIDKDASAQLWRNYSFQGGPGFRRESERLLPNLAFAEHILRYAYAARVVFARHGIYEPRIIVRARLENVSDKILVHDNSGSIFSPPIQSPILETDYVICDHGEEEKILRELWYSAGAHGLNQKVMEVVRSVAAQAKQWNQGGV